MRTRVLVYYLIIGAVLLVAVIDRGKKMMLPQAAHNTIGEIPLIEHFDDGDLNGRNGYDGFWAGKPAESVPKFNDLHRAPSGMILIHSMVSCGFSYREWEEGNNDMD